jgi:hypothetical protein
MIEIIETLETIESAGVCEETLEYKNKVEAFIKRDYIKQ